MRVAHIRVDARLVGLGLLYSFASLGVAQKYAGTAAAFALLVAGPALGLLGGTVVDLAMRLSERQALVATGCVVVLAVAAFLVVYPHANTHLPDQGSDRDDAATIGARGFLHGHDPYGSFTYLHNPISQLPTLLVVAMPFVALFGSSAYALVVFLPLLALLLWRLAHGAPAALGWLLVALASPMLLRDYLTGGDLITNTVIVVAACLAAWAAAPRGPWWAAGTGVALGVALASRANFVIVAVPLLVAVARRSRVRRAAEAGLAATVTFAAIVVPLALTQSGRTALSMNDKLSTVTGGAPLVLTLVTLLALVLAARTSRWTRAALFAQAAVAQTAFLLAVVVSSSVEAGRPDFSWLISSYGIPAYLLAVCALAARDHDG